MTRFATARRGGLRTSTGVPSPALRAVAKRHQRRGFTLLELVAATALSAVLLTVVLAVIRTANRATPAADDALPLADQLRWDLSNAVVIGADSHGLTVAGYGSLDPATLAATRGPAVVTYALRSAGDHVWLVREQSELSARSSATAWAELAAADVTGLTVDAPIKPADQSAATRPSAEDPTPLPFQHLAGLYPVPPRVRVTVRFANRPPVDVEAFR